MKVKLKYIKNNSSIKTPMQDKVYIEYIYLIFASLK